MRDHLKKYREVAGAMVTHTPLPLDRDLTLSEVLSAYDEYLQTPDGRFAAFSHYHEMILLAAFFGKASIAVSILNRCLAEVAHSKFRNVGGPEEFETSMLTQIEHPAVIRDIVEQEIIILKAQHLPRSAMIA